MVTMAAVGEQSNQARSEQLMSQALRLYARYAEEIIEAHGFCPWAAEARRGGEVQTEVLLGPLDVGRALECMAAVAANERIAIGLLIFPEAQVERIAFQHFAAELREADRRAHGQRSPTWAVADFHPDARPDLESAERMVAYIRRTPDPTLQLVRHSVLARVRRRHPDGGTRFVDPQKVVLDTMFATEHSNPAPLHTMIAQRNLATVRDLGLASLEAKLDEIHQDRHATYARLGLPNAPWTKGFAGR